MEVHKVALDANVLDIPIPMEVSDTRRRKKAEYWSDSTPPSLLLAAFWGRRDIHLLFAG